MLFLFLLVGLVSSSSTASSHSVRDDVDLVELNHYHDESGRHVFDQLIFYDWSEQKRRFDVRAWRLVKVPGQLPLHDHKTNVWRMIWHDAGMLRTVEAAAYRETWTQYDPELINREFLSQENRRELTKLPPQRLSPP